MILVGLQSHKTANEVCAFIQKVRISPGVFRKKNAKYFVVLGKKRADRNATLSYPYIHFRCIP